MTTLKKIGVIGAGQMGSGIAQVCARAGYDVLLNDVSADRINAGMANVGTHLGRQASAGKISDTDRANTLAHIAPALGYEALADADLVLEAAVEDEAVKREILRHISKVLKPGALLGAQTSSFSTTRLAAPTRRPERFRGILFMSTGTG